MSTNCCDAAPKLFILVENPSKSNNLGSILRCASAFGITTIVTVGFSKCAVQGSHGASKNIELVAFPTVDQAKVYIKNELLCSSIIGLMGALPDGYDQNGCPVYENFVIGKAEFILNGGLTNRFSLPLERAPITCYGNICIGLSKDRQGLSLSISRCCDSLIHIPHYPVCGDTPLLDTPSCLSIMLSFITRSIGYNERVYHGNKFEVMRPVRTIKTEMGQNQQRKQLQEDVDLCSGGWNSLKQSDNDGDY